MYALFREDSFQDFESILVVYILPDCFEADGLFIVVLNPQDILFVCVELADDPDRI